jgi:hypothetical protein
VREQDGDVGLPPPRCSGDRSLLKEDPAAFDLRDGELLAAEARGQPDMLAWTTCSPQAAVCDL